MTACVNRKHSKKVAAVVTASLVGALSLGVAPVAAMANEGIETLAAADWYTEATVSRATDGKGGYVSDPANAVFEQGSGRYLKPTQLENSMGDTTPVDTDGYVYNYYKKESSGDVLKAASDGTGPSSVSNFFKNAPSGTYYVKIAKKGASAEVAGPFYFRISDAESDVTYQFCEAGTDGSDTAITYIGGAWLTTSVTSNLDIVDSNGNVHDTYTVNSIKTIDGTNVTEAKDAGTYVVNVTVDGESFDMTLTIGKLDLSTAALSIADGTTGYADGATLLGALEVEGRKPASGIIKVDSVDGPGSAGFTAKGTYTVTLSSNDNPNVTGTGTVSFNVLDTDLFANGYDVKYGRNAVNNTGSNDIELWLEDGDSFDVSKVTVSSSDGKTVYSGDQLEITLADDEGNVVEPSALGEPGEYTMSVRVKPFDSIKDGFTGGTKTNIGIRIHGTELADSENLAFYIDGKPAGTADAVTYDGTDQLDRLTVKVKQGDKVFEEGTDYTLEVKDENGKVVEEAVNANSAGKCYTVTVKPLTFEFGEHDDPTFKLTVNPVTVEFLYPVVSGIVYNENGSVNDGDSSFDVPYTGSAIELPSAMYEVNDGDGTYSYVELPSDVYNVVTIRDKAGKQVEEVVDEGEYTVTIALSEAAEGNYNLTGTGSFTFSVREFGVFADVDPTAWYAVAVEQANDLGYMTGIKGTDLFMPLADISRAELSKVFFNMAGQSEDEGVYFPSAFADVDGWAWYAQPVAWASEAGIVTGYDADTFGPMDKASREQVAVMLYRYAKAQGKDVSVKDADAALAAYKDGDQVSDWAKTAMAWAVENGIFGVDTDELWANQNIQRAAVASIAVRFQPEALPEA